MSTWIECRYGGELLRVVLGNESVTIGRSTDCHLALPGDKEISRVHATIERHHQAWYIHDNHSTNGTFVNSHRVTVPHVLRDADVIQVGEQWIHVKEWVEPETTSDRPVEFSHSTYYSVLRVTRHATQEEIDGTYKELSRIYDPVLHNFSTMAGRLKDELEEAYATLRDPQARADYDSLLSTDTVKPRS